MKKGTGRKGDRAFVTCRFHCSPLYHKASCRSLLACSLSPNRMLQEVSHGKIGLSYINGKCKVTSCAHRFKHLSCLCSPCLLPSRNHGKEHQLLIAPVCQETNPATPSCPGPAAICSVNPGGASPRCSGCGSQRPRGDPQTCRGSSSVSPTAPGWEPG